MLETIDNKIINRSTRSVEDIEFTKEEVAAIEEYVEYTIGSTEENFIDLLVKYIKCRMEGLLSGEFYYSDSGLEVRLYDFAKALIEI